MMENNLIIVTVPYDCRGRGPAERHTMCEVRLEIWDTALGLREVKSFSTIDEAQAYLKKEGE